MERNLQDTPDVALNHLCLQKHIADDFPPDQRDKGNLPDSTDGGISGMSEVQMQRIDLPIKMVAVLIFHEGRRMSKNADSISLLDFDTSHTKCRWKSS